MRALTGCLRTHLEERILSVLFWSPRMRRTDRPWGSMTSLSADSDVKALRRVAAVSPAPATPMCSSGFRARLVWTRSPQGIVFPAPAQSSQTDPSWREVEGERPKARSQDRREICHRREFSRGSRFLDQNSADPADVDPISPISTKSRPMSGQNWTELGEIWLMLGRFPPNSTKSVPKSSSLVPISPNLDRTRPGGI